MSEKLRESLSAVVDGEADEFELRRVLDELPKDPQLRVAWSRYHLIGAVLRSERVVSASLRERVWAELDLEETAEEPVLESQAAPPSAQRRNPMVARVMGVAVAAVVAAGVVLVGLNGAFEEGDSGGRLVANTTGSADEGTSVIVTRPMSPQERDHIESLMLRHTQQLGMNQPNLAAFTKMVTYQRQ
jgi:sigma-E factor negative regulatory protein RseA